MRFTDNWPGRLLLGIVFSLFMLAIFLIYALFLVPVFIVEFGAILIGGASTPVQMFTGLIGLLVLLGSFVVTGWAVFYFIRKNTFVYKYKR